MPLWNLSYEKVEEIKEQTKQKEDELQFLQKKSVKKLWLDDLMEFETMLDKVEIEEEEDRKKN
jgi:hypothetical protein